MSGSNIVAEWLRSLHLGQYAESFLDNGYDDLEICKQVGDPDLDAIGVFNPSHRSRLLQSVRTLREEGAASVYFTLEESQAIQEECKCETSSARSSRSGGKNSDKDSGRSPSSNGSAHELPRYLDEYEEGKAELVRIPRLQLKILLREKLNQDGIRLSNQPYSTSTGERGYLEGVGSRYAELFNTHYSDVLGHLEELRQREWAELSPRFRVLSGTTGGATTAVLQNGAPPQHLQQTAGATPGTGGAGGTLARHNGLVTSLSQPIYVPGKYSPSSCLSDREEDEIYGFAGYNVYGGGPKAHPSQQQQHVAAATSAVRPHPRQPQLINKHNFQNWLSPRSAYFYELPPSERPTKKRTSLTRLLRHLKTHRKDKSSTSRNNHRVCSPDEPAMSAPLTADYDKMRLLHKVGRTTTTFEETIHRLKVQEALKKKERIDREHEETRPGGMSVTQILRDIRAGVLVGSSHISSPGGGGASSRQAASSAASHPDDTYMYDDEMSRLGQQHWYDEPPYESDPEDFLMQADPSPPAAVTLHNSRLCFTMRGGGEDCLGGGGARGSEVSEVISLRSAGDISLPSQQRALLVPCHTARSNRNNNRESGDYAASDVNSICSRLSSLSMETSRSEHLEMDVYHRLRPYNGGEPAISPGHSSDYAEHDELVSSLQPRCGEVVSSSRSRKCGDSSSSSSKSLGRRHHHHHHHHHHHVHHRQPRPHHSSAESLPSASSTQALVSNMEEYSPQGGGGPLVPLARALVDAQPNHYDPDALRFKKGDIIEVLKMSKSGVWRGRVHGRTGHFKFINVELLSSGLPNMQPNIEPHHPQSKPHRITNRPLTLEEMLTAIHMEEHMSLFVLNGYEDLESFCEIREEDLDYLGLTDPEHRAKILAAVQVLQEFEQTEEEWNKNDQGIPPSKEAANNLSQLNIQPHPGMDQSLADSTSFLPNIPVSSSSDPPPLPAPSGPVQPPACVLTPQTPQSGSGGGKGGSSDSGVSSSSAGSSVRGGGGGGGGSGRPRPPPPPKPGSATPDSPSYVNHVVIEAANGTSNISITNEPTH